MGSLLRRLLFLFRRDRLDRDLDEELRFHEEMTAQSLADDMGGDEARAAARRRVGNPLRLRERAREPWTFPTIETLAQDVRHALRLMRRDPAFTITALATLALGIGLSTAIFSVAYGVLWRPLPYPNPDRLVILSAAQQTGKGVKTIWTWAPVSYAALGPRLDAFDHLAAYVSIEAQLTGRGEPLQVPAVEVSPNFFTTLGVGPAHGRTFLAGAGAADDDRAVIVSDRLWRSSLKADPAFVGQSITINGLPRTVVGVLPRGFSFRPVVRAGALPEADVFLPSRWPGDAGRSAFLYLLGRMKPGVNKERAETELTALVNDPSIVAPGALAPEGVLAPNVRTIARTAGLQEYGAGPVRTLLLIVLGAVAFVLLIACVNVANLQMARLTARRGELSVRMALGAGRRRVVRQLLTEALVLSLGGAAFGVLLARIAIDVTLPLVPQAVLPRLGGIEIDGGVMAFSIALTLVSGLLIGLVPALRVSGTALADGRALHAGEARTTGDGPGERLRTLLVVAQVAMTLVLLIGAGLLMHSFVRLTSVSPGFEASGRDGVVSTVRVTLPERLFDRPERIHAFARGVLDRVRYLPGVTAASLVNSPPFGRMFIQGDFSIEGQPKPNLAAGRPKIGAGYFQTLGIPLLAGREFTAGDTAEAPRVAIVSERIVRECLPGGPGEALGRRVRLDGLSDGSEWLTVVGVVADIRHMGLDRDVQPMIYVPFQQDRSDFVRFVSFVARTSNSAAVVEGIRAEIRRAAPDLAITATVTMDEAVAASVAPPRFRMLVLGLFALAATLIATCGIYGLMAYAVTQRRREIGVRVALGAERSDVLRLVLGRALQVVTAGAVLGLAGAIAVTRVLRTFLFGVTPTDPLAFTVVTAALVAVGLTAAWVPARRATRIDPVEALRAE
ncbi:MAG TPA: ABC transporter permease [Vicinamibacterales bacterium]|nr:ABC transporter permease [Acidobacteriota bacterium]HOC17430.1 ABC transporter permease [Vicinamibacterales bacterium]